MISQTFVSPGYRRKLEINEVWPNIEMLQFSFLSFFFLEKVDVYIYFIIRRRYYKLKF